MKKELIEIKENSNKKYPLSKALAILGSTTIAISIIRWFFIFEDPSQLSLGIGIGLNFILVSYFYKWAKNQENKVDNLIKIVEELGSV